MSEDPEGAGAAPVRWRVRCCLFGLLVAFTFTSAASRYETRRDLIVQHTNAIGTAWLRLRPAARRGSVGAAEGFRFYVDGIIKVHQQVGDKETVNQVIAYLGKLQDEI